MSIITKGLHEINDILVNVCVRHNLAGPDIELSFLWQLSVDQKVGYLNYDESIDRSSPSSPLYLKK